jgi:5-methylcytosine-specific restriction endonuclease McrA
MQARIDGTELIPARTARRRFRQEILSAWEHRCAYCGRDAGTLDHVHPASRGGMTVAENLVACCAPCNLAKGSREVLSWWREQPFWLLDRELRLLHWLEPQAGA